MHLASSYNEMNTPKMESCFNTKCVTETNDMLNFNLYRHTIGKWNDNILSI